MMGYCWIHGDAEGHAAIHTVPTAVASFLRRPLLDGTENQLTRVDKSQITSGSSERRRLQVRRMRWRLAIETAGLDGPIPGRMMTKTRAKAAGA